MIKLVCRRHTHIRLPPSLMFSKANKQTDTRTFICLDGSAAGSEGGGWFWVLNWSPTDLRPNCAEIASAESEKPPADDRRVEGGLHLLLTHRRTEEAAGGLKRTEDKSTRCHSHRRPLKNEG